MVGQDILDSPALPLLVELEHQGFSLRLTDRGVLRVEPGSRLTAGQRQQLIEYKASVVTILRCCDAGVVARRDAFERQLDGVAAPRVPALLFKTDVPYTMAVCFSCGDPNGRPSFGRCWRCALAARLALRLPISSALAQALDDARVA